jgi:hypothetical protein
MKRLMALVTIFALAAAPMATRIEAAPPAAGSGLAVPVSGSAPGGAFNGTFRITRFVNSGGDIFAQGVLTGIATATAADGTTTRQSIVRTVSTPVTTGQAAQAVSAAAASTQAVCDVLHLVLGPLHLDLLGLVIDLNQVVLDITAESGPGNLLGNLLCAVTGLLDGGGNTNGVTNLLNQILAVLAG